MPPIILNAGGLLSRYDVLLCDVWGVAHDGHRAYRGANTALKRFRESGGTVILVSNAPVPGARVQEMLERVGFWREAWDDIVSSGEIALDHVEAKGYQRLYRIGPADRDAALFSKLPGIHTALSTADAIICTGLNDDRNETAESYRLLLTEALALNLPFVCANPDLVVHVGGHELLCAGAIAQVYEEMGGEVYWAGKPHPSAYKNAIARAVALRGSPVSKSRVLGIGDAVRTDIKAAEVAQVDALFITGGIHRDEVMSGERVCPEKLAALFAQPDAPRAVAAMAQLCW